MTPSDKFIPASWLPYIRRGDSRIIAKQCEVNPHYAWQWLAGHREWKPSKHDEMLLVLGELIQKRRATEQRVRQIA